MIFIFKVTLNKKSLAEFLGEKENRMKSKLKEYFPLIQERGELLDEIRANEQLTTIFEGWPGARQEEFLDFCTGVKGVKVLYDSFFKEIMNPEYTPERLESFLSVVLKRKTKIIRILPNDSTRIADETSLLITDIIVELEDGSLANVEIQKIGYTFPGERSACYSADMLLRQYKRVRSTSGDKFSYNNVKNVYLIVIYENSPKEFKKLSTEYYHHGKQKFDTGLELNMLQEFIMIPLDIFRKNMDNKNIENLLEAWLTFLTNDEPERIIELITCFPEFKSMYETMYQMCQNVERMMNMFSEELRIMDRNTVKYMIEEQAQQLEEQMRQLEDQNQQIIEQALQIENQNQQIENQNQQIENQNQQIENQNQQIENQNQQIEEQAQYINEYKAAQRSAIESLLREKMTVDRIASILGCEVAYVEEVKEALQIK